MFLLWLRQLTWCGDQTPTSAPPPAKGRSSLTNSPVFPPGPLYYWVLHWPIYTFLLVRSSCPLSAAVLHALLCLKVCSWCIHGKRCTPRPPTPPHLVPSPLFTFCCFYFSGVGRLAGHITNYLSLNKFHQDPIKHHCPGSNNHSKPAHTGHLPRNPVTGHLFLRSLPFSYTAFCSALSPSHSRAWAIPDQGQHVKCR